LERSYIGVQIRCWMFDFVHGYLCEIITRSIAFSYRTVYIVGSCSRHGIPSFKRLTTYVFFTQLDGIIDMYTFYNSGNNKIIMMSLLHLRPIRTRRALMMFNFKSDFLYSSLLDFSRSFCCCVAAAQRLCVAYDVLRPYTPPWDCARSRWP